MTQSQSVQSIITRMLTGDRAALSRLLTFVENRDERLPEIIQKIHSRTGRAQILGVTGPPGAGKSTLVDKLTVEYRKLGQKVAVIAVDPSSPFSGGAVLGDRIRMLQHALDDGVFIRSLGTRGMQGGVSMATQEFIQCFDAAGYDQIIVETAGVGQTEWQGTKYWDRTTFVIDPNGILRKVYLKVKPEGHEKALLTDIQAMKAKGN